MPEREDATHRLLNSGGPALVQHRPALSIVDLEPQGEANGSDVICRVLQQTSTMMSASAAVPRLRGSGASASNFCYRPNSRRHGREVCGRRFGPCELGPTAGSACGSCHQTRPARTASCRPAWRTPRGLRRRRRVGGTAGERWTLLAPTVHKQNLRICHTKAVAVRSG